MSSFTYQMRRFDSIGDFVKASRSKATAGQASHKTGGDWSGTKTYEEAVKYATEGGWNPENLLEFRHMFDELEPKLRKFVTSEYERGSDQSGFEVNMQAFLDGEPDCMFQWLPDEHVVTKRAVCVLIGHSVSASVTAETLFIRGQAAIALVRALSLLGYELELWSEQTVRGGYQSGRSNERYSILTRLHGAGQVMDESAVEYAIGNPSWLRRLIFGLEEGEPKKIRDQYGFGYDTKWGGYGGPDGIHHAELVNADVQLDLGSSWFQGDKGYGDTAEGGMHWVVDQLKKLGVVDADAEWED